MLTALFVAAGVKSASRVPYKYLVLTWLAVAAILISRRLIREAFLVVQVRKMALVAPRAAPRRTGDVLIDRFIYLIRDICLCW